MKFKKAFGIVETLAAVIILSLVVGGTVRLVQVSRNNAAAADAYSQKQAMLKNNADLLTDGNIVKTKDAKATGVEYMKALGSPDADAAVEVKTISSSTTGTGVVDDLVQLVNADGWLAVGSVSRIETAPEAPTPTPTLSVSITATPNTVPINTDYTVAWSSVGADQVVVVESYVNAAGNTIETEISRALQHTGLVKQKADAGRYVYTAIALGDGGRAVASAEVNVDKPLGDLEIFVSANASSGWTKNLTLPLNLPASSRYYVRYRKTVFPSATVLMNSAPQATLTNDSAVVVEKTIPANTTATWEIRSGEYHSEAVVVVPKAAMYASSDPAGLNPITSIPAGVKFYINYQYQGMTTAYGRLFRQFPSGDPSPSGSWVLSPSTHNTIHASGSGWAKGTQSVNASTVGGVMNFYLRENNGNPTDWATCAVNVIALTGRIWSNPTRVDVNQTSTITWECSGPAVINRRDPSGYVTNGWGSSGAGTNSRVDNGLSRTGTYTYYLTSGGKTLGNCTVDVGQQNKKDLGISADPRRVRVGQAYIVSWRAGGHSTAVVTGPNYRNNVSTAKGTLPSSFEQFKGDTVGDKTYTITAPDGSRASVTVEVYQDGGAYVDISASATTVGVGEAYTVIWDSAGCSTVNVSGSKLSSTQKSGTSSPITQTTTGAYTYTIVGDGGAHRDEVTVNVVPAASGGGSSVRIWSDHQGIPVLQGESFTVFWEANGVSSATTIGRNPDTLPFGAFPQQSSLVGQRTMNTSTSWQTGNYTFTITGDGKSASCQVLVTKESSVDLIIPRTSSAPMYDIWDIVYDGNTLFDSFDHPRDRKPNHAVGYIAHSIAERMKLYKYASLYNWIVLSVITSNSRPSPSVVSYGPVSIPLVAGGYASVSADVRWEKTSPIDPVSGEFRSMQLDPFLSVPEKWVTQPMYYEKSTNTYYGLNCIVTVYGLSSTMYP